MPQFYCARVLPHRDEIPPATLYLLTPKTLARSGKVHGHEIANATEWIPSDLLKVE